MSNTLSAKEVAAMCDMTAKNFRKHLRESDISQDRKQKQYSFTQKQAEKIVALFTDDSDDERESAVVAE